MGKIVKYCAACDESFTEKFSFCPNCAAELNAYEMNPLSESSKSVESINISEPVKVESVTEMATTPIIETEKTEPAVSAIEPQPPAF